MGFNWMGSLDRNSFDSLFSLISSKAEAKVSAFLLFTKDVTPFGKIRAGSSMSVQVCIPG